MSRARLDALLRVIEFARPAVAPGVDLARELAADPAGAAHLAARADADRAALAETGWGEEDGGPLPFEHGYQPAEEVG